MTRRLFSKSGLSLERLRTFSEVVAAGGISHAAPGDPNRQSQFSRQLKELEEFFGAKFLHRGGGRFELTPAGHELFRIVQLHFKALEDLAGRFAAENIEISIGAGESVLHGLVLPNLAELRRRHPAVTLTLHNLRSEEIADRLLDGRIDLGIMRQESARTPLKSVRLGSVRYCLVTPKKQAKAPTKKQWSAIQQYPIALLAGSDVAVAFELEAVKHGAKLDICLRGSSYAQLFEAVNRLKCAAVIPLFAAAPLKGKCEMVSLSIFSTFVRPTALVWNPRQSNLRPTIKTVAETLESLLTSCLTQFKESSERHEGNEDSDADA